MVGWKWRDGDVEAASATDRQDRLAPLAATSSFARGPDALDRFISADLGGLRSRAPGHVPPPTNLVASINPTNAELDARLLDKRQKKKHNVVMNSRVDKLYEVPIPAGWKHSPRFATRTEMRQARHHQSIALHPSYDVDGDGFIGQDDYSIASKHDLGATRMLTGCVERPCIIQAMHPPWSHPPLAPALLVTHACGTSHCLPLTQRSMWFETRHAPPHAGGSGIAPSPNPATAWGRS